MSKNVKLKLQAKRKQAKAKNTPKAEEDPLQNLDAVLSTAREFQDNLDFENAAKLYYKAIQLDPSNTGAMDELGEILIALDECPMALQVLQKSIELSPQGGWSKYLNIGQLLDSDNALKAYKVGVELMVQFFQTLTLDVEREPFGNQIASAFCSMAELYLTDLCFAPTAETDCAQLIELALKYGPKSPEPLQLLCNFRISQQQNGEALAALQQSMALWHEKESQDLPPYDFRVTTGQLLLELGQHQAAADILSQLTQEDDEVVEVWYFLAVAFSHIDPVAAEECAESAAAVLQKFGAAEGDPLPGQVAEILAKMKAHNLAHPPAAATAEGEEDDDDDEDEADGAMVDS